MGFSILGPLRVRAAGSEVPLASAKQRLLLAALLVEAGSVVAVDRLADILWGGDQPGDPVQAVHSHVSRLRSVLESAGGTQARDLLVTRSPGYVIALNADQLDAHRFEHLVGRARTAEEPVRVVELVDEALSLWHGAPLAGFDHPFVRAEASRLDELKLGAIEVRADARLALGRHGEVVAELEALTSDEPLREQLHGRLMLALYRGGRQADALATYRALRDRLADELGLEPSPALRRLEQDILQQHERLAPPSTESASAAVPGARSTADSSGRYQPVGTDAVTVGALPVEATSFVGRADEVTGAASALEGARTVTLTGPGGVGKTRLALRVARDVADRFSDGVVMCDLAAIDDGGTVVQAGATALGVQPQKTSDVEDALIGFLRPKRLLLLLDNCEHVLSGVCELVERIVRECPETSILATSRQPLAVVGEQVWPVGPLQVAAEEGEGPSAAVRLFRDRAVAADPDFRLAADNRATVAEICRRLDGLPLAIELAAARVRSMTLGDIVDRLDRRFDLLTNGRRAGASRHRTLQAVVDWSYGLLDDRERRLFPRLTVFTGGFGLDAAEAVCADQAVPRGEVAAALAQLVDHSLVVADRSGRHVRYRLLETLRTYGQARLGEQDDAAVWGDRHAEHFVSLTEEAAEGIRGSDEARWVAVLDQELDNLRAAHRWTITAGAVDLALRMTTALTYYAYFRLRDEIFRWAEDTLELAGTTGHPLYPAACGTAGYGCANRGELHRAVAYAHRGLDAASSKSDPASLRPLVALSDVALYEGRLDERIRLGTQLTELARAAEDRFEESLSHLHRGLTFTYMGRSDEALACVDRGRALAETAGNPTLIAWFLYLEGEILLDADPERAVRLLEQAMATARRVANRFTEGVARVSAASVAARHGDARTALEAFREAVENWKQAGDWTHQWTTLRNIVVLLTRLGVHECAAVVLGATESADTAAPPYGADADRLTAIAAELASALGDEGFAQAERRGRMMADDEAIAYVLTAIERLLADVA